MALSKKKTASGSAQVGDWKFTYQDRIHTFRGVDLAEGTAALLAYGELFGRLERKLFARFCAGVTLVSLKKAYLSEHRIPARMFNSLRVSVEGKVSAVRASMDRQLESLVRRLARAEEQLAHAFEQGWFNAAHQKKRRLQKSASQAGGSAALTRMLAG